MKNERRHGRRRHDAFNRTVVVALIVLLSVAPLISAAEDGYTMLQEACRKYEKTGLGQWDPDYRALRDYLRLGGIPGTNVITVIERSSDMLVLLEQAVTAKTWTVPDPSTINLQQLGNVPVPTIPCFGLFMLATTQAAIDVYNGRLAKGLDTLHGLRRMSNRLMKGSCYLTWAVLETCEGKQRQLLATIADMLPTNAAAGELTVLIELYKDNARYETILQNERWFVRNSINDYFANLAIQVDVTRTNLVATLKKAGAEQDGLKDIAAGKVLTVQEWKAYVLDELRAIEDIQRRADRGTARDELWRMDETVYARIQGLATNGTTHTLETLLSAFTNMTVHADLPLRKWQRLHDDIGRAIAGELLGTLVRRYGTGLLGYRKSLAYHRLLLIRFACRAFADRKGRECEHLSELVDDGILEPEMIIDPQSGTTFHKGLDECGEIVFFCHDGTRTRDKYGPVVVLPYGRSAGPIPQVKEIDNRP